MENLSTTQTESALTSEAAANHQLEEKTRFEVELEFVQCLSNPRYLHFLSQNGYFDDPAFLNYLEYLKYWTRTDYAKFITYPQCLFFLARIQDEKFQKELAKPDFSEYLFQQQFYHWQYGGG